MLTYQELYKRVLEKNVVWIEMVTISLAVFLFLSGTILAQNLGSNDVVVKNLLGIGSTQSVAVSGRLICNGRPAANIKLKLYENEISEFSESFFPIHL